MTAPGSLVYCPLIQQMVNVSSEPSNSTSNVSALGLFTVCLHGLVSSLGILENLLILGVVGFHVRRTVISVWILNLAASDLLATASLPFFTLFMARGTWSLGTTFCRLQSSVFFLNMFVSGFLLAAISLDRCLVVLRPVWAQNCRNVRLVGKVCGVIWAMALLCTVPFYLFRDTIPKRSGIVLCYYNYARFLPSGDFDLASVCEARQEAMGLMKLFLAFLLPLVVIIASYAAVTVAMVRRGHRRSIRFVRLIVAVVVSFAVCWAPYHIFSIMEVLAPHRSSLRRFAAHSLPIATSIAFFNSVLNPMLYVFSCPDICSKIRESLAAVTENGMARRQSAVRSSISNTGTLLRTRTSLPTLGLRGHEGQEQGPPQPAVVD
ncbi:prostaglandin D2 receptor 2-like [Polymixia lowei]